MAGKKNMFSPAAVVNQQRGSMYSRFAISPMLYLQTILIQQEVHQSHHQNALFIAPGLDIVFHNNNLFERVVNIYQRLGFLILFSPCQE